MAHQQVGAHQHIITIVLPHNATTRSQYRIALEALVVDTVAMEQSIDERRVVTNPDRDHTISTARHRDMAVTTTNDRRATGVRASDRRSDSSSSVVQPHAAVRVSYT